MENDNPYRSPTDPRRGEYDHSLWWAFVRAVAKICLVLLFIDGIAMTRYAKVANQDRPIVNVAWGFFSDWKSGSAPTWPDIQAAMKGQQP